MCLVQVLLNVRFEEMISFEFHLKKRHEKTPKPLWFWGFSNRYLFRFAMLVAGAGFEPFRANFVCLHSCGTRHLLWCRHTPSPLSTAAPRRHKLHIVRFRIVHESSLISLLLLFPKSLLDFSGTLLCSLHPPPDAVACVAPGTRRSSVQPQVHNKKTRHTKRCSEFFGCGSRI